MWHTANARYPLRRLVRVCLQPNDQFLQVVGRHGLLRHHQTRIGCDQRYGCEVIHQVVLKRVGGAVEDVCAFVAEDECVAVACRARDRPRPRRALRANPFREAGFGFHGCLSELAVKARPAGRCRSGSDIPAPRRQARGQDGKPTRRTSEGREATRVLTPCCGGASTMKRAGRQREPSRGLIQEPDARRVPPYPYRP